ncbi:hypothetical protein QBZ16_001256 [Prototheca wickerhamii]|uniref:Uncharacterized protein n=1 Tax=Prototheca wickerhamii TaxID=3111 RepID=A0AAD9IFY0_PROWI|nr:hypothetical protein QBZ16_001256 [Prototheca wickerhamii]
MSRITFAREFLGVIFEVATQKLSLRGVPELPDIGASAEGLTIIVTGPTGGIGQQSAAELARRGAKVILACRNVPKGEAYKKELEEQAAAAGRPAPKLEVMELDVSSLASVRSFAEAWLARKEPLHVLVNNAGILAMAAPYKLTEEGFENHLVTNYLGHYLLTLLLLPSLEQATNQARAGWGGAGHPARVVSVASKLHYMGAVRKDDLNLQKGYTSLDAYCQSKLLQVLFAGELERRARGRVRSLALHPGEVLTNVVNTLPSPLQRLYRQVMTFPLLTPDQGARSTVHCATAPQVEEEPDKVYYHSSCVPIAPSALALDRDLARWVWDWSAEAVALSSDQDLAPAP